MREYPISKYDKRGRLVCPTCGFTTPIPIDRYLGRGEMACGNGHRSMVDDDVAYAVNDILQRANEHRWRRDPLKNFEETPAFLVNKEKGRIIVP